MCLYCEYVVVDFEFSEFVFDFEFSGFVFDFEFSRCVCIVSMLYLILNFLGLCLILNFFYLNFEFSGEKKTHKFLKNKQIKPIAAFLNAA